jgi:hypothetical protein
VKVVAPFRLTVEGCAAVLTEYARLATAVYGWQLDRGTCDITRRVVLYAIAGGVLRWVEEPKARGSRGFLDSVEVSLGAVQWMIGCMYGHQAAKFTALYHGEAIRKGLRGKARSVLLIRDGVASVVDAADVGYKKPEDLALHLWEVRDIVESIARRLGYGPKVGGGGTPKGIPVSALRRVATYGENAIAALEARHGDQSSPEL